MKFIYIFEELFALQNVLQRRGVESDGKGQYMLEMTVLYLRAFRAIRTHMFASAMMGKNVTCLLKLQGVRIFPTLKKYCELWAIWFVNHFCNRLMQ